MAALLGPKPGTVVLTIVVGIVVGSNFAITKYVVAQGVSPLFVLLWVLLVSSGILLAAIALNRQRLCLRSEYLRYYVIAGILGISAPQYLSYFILKEIPVSLFTALVTLSPLFTLILTYILKHRQMPANRLMGILTGLAGVTLATTLSFDMAEIEPGSLLVALSLPLLLGFANLYRSEAYPKDAHALSLAAGTLSSQVLLLLPTLVWMDGVYHFGAANHTVKWFVWVLGVITAVSYLLVYELQARTDGVGVSQVGYFATVTGVAIGVLVFDEPFSLTFFVAVLLLMLGLLITNGQVNLTNFLVKGR